MRKSLFGLLLLIGIFFGGAVSSELFAIADDSLVLPPTITESKAPLTASEINKRAEKRAKRRYALNNLLGKIAKLPKFPKLNYEVPETQFFSFNPSIGESWYRFGLGAGAGYHAFARVEPAALDLQVGAATRAYVSTTLFGYDITVLEGLLGAGNHFSPFSAGVGGAGYTLPQTVADGDKWKKWVPVVKAEALIFGITVWSKKAPDQEPPKGDLDTLDDSLNAGGGEKTSSSADDQFTQTLNANQTTIGQGSTGTDAQAGATKKPKKSTFLQKSLLDYKKGLKDIAGSALFIPVVGPLGIEIDFGIFFSFTLNYEMGISGLGFNFNVSSASGSIDWLSAAKNGLASNQLVSSATSLMTGDFSSGDLGSLLNIEEGIDALEEIYDTSRDQLGDTVNGEIKGSVNVLPAASAGVWVKCSATLDLLVVSASAGVKGTLKLINAKLGGGVELSSVSDYATIMATGSINLLSGSLELFASATVNYLIGSKTWEWSTEVFHFDGITHEFTLPIARLAYRGDGAPRGPFMCIDGSFNQIEHPYGPSFTIDGKTQQTDECNVTVKKVPSTSSGDLSADVKDLLNNGFDIYPPDPNDNCYVTLNHNTIVRTYTVSGGTAESVCKAHINDADVLEQARQMYSEKFVSNLYGDGADNLKPVVLLEAYYMNASKTTLIEDAKYVSADITTNQPEDWTSIVAARDPKNAPVTKGSDDCPDIYSCIPDTEPQFNDIKTPVRQIGIQSNDGDLVSRALAFRTGFCTLAKGGIGAQGKPDPNCDYTLKALGVNYPDGKSCISNNWTALQTYAAKYDCAPKDSSGAVDKVAACLIRRAFSANLCFPPQKADYIVRLANVLNTLTEPDLFNLLAYNNLHYYSCQYSGTEAQVDEAAAYNKRTQTSCEYDGKVFRKYVDYRQYNPYTKRIFCGLDPNYGYYGKACKDGFTFGGITGPSGSFLSWKMHTDLPATNPTLLNVTQDYIDKNDPLFNPCLRSQDYPYTQLFFDKSPGLDGGPGSIGINPAFSEIANVGSDYRSLLKNGNCLLQPEGFGAIATKSTKELDKKYDAPPPPTCELLATYLTITGSPHMFTETIDRLLDTKGGTQQSVSNRYECKSAFAANLDQLCRTSKNKLTSPLYGPRKFMLRTQFQKNGNLVDELGYCQVNPDDSVFAVESGPTATSSTAAADASSANNCEILVGSKSANKLFMAKLFRGLDDPVSANTACSALAKDSSGKVNCAALIDSTIERTLRTSSLPDLAKVEVYARLRDAAGAAPALPATPLGTCNLAEPPAQLACQAGAGVDPKNCIPNAACELFAMSQLNYKVRIARSTSQKTSADCTATFKPESVICEQLTRNPAIQQENATTNNTAFVNGKPVALTVRFTPAPASSTAATPASTSTPLTTCTYGVIPSGAALCELLVTTADGFVINMNAKSQNQAAKNLTWLSKDLSSKAATSQADCKNRFLSGAIGGTQKPDPTCYALSGQLGTYPIGGDSTKAVSPALKSTTVTLTSRYTYSSQASGGGSASCPAGTDPVICAIMLSLSNVAIPTIQKSDSLGSCSYDADGNSTLINTLNPDLDKAKRKLAGDYTGLDTGMTGAGPGPEITDLTLDATNPSLFWLSVRYLGPQPVLDALKKFQASTPVWFKDYTVRFPDAPAGVQNVFAGYALPAKDQTTKIGPFPISLIGKKVPAALCAKGVDATVITSVTDTPQSTMAALKITSPAVERAFSKKLDVPCSTVTAPQIVVRSIVPDGANTSFNIVSQNVGGPPSGSQTVKFTITNTGNKTTTTVTSTVKSPGAGMLSNSFAAATLGMSCGPTAANLEITSDLSPPGYKFTTSIVPCLPPQIEITRVVAGTDGATFTVEYQNTGKYLVAGKMFDLTIKNTDPGALGRTKTISGIAVPAASAKALTAAVPLSSLAMACGQASNLAITTTLSAPGYSFPANAVTVKCPVNIIVTNVSAPLYSWNFTVEYQNIGAEPALNQTFDLTIKNLTAGATPNTKILKALTVPAKNAKSVTTQIPISDLGLVCDKNTNLTITTTGSAAGYVNTSLVTPKMCGTCGVSPYKFSCAPGYHCNFAGTTCVKDGFF